MDERRTGRRSVVLKRSVALRNKTSLWNRKGVVLIRERRAAFVKDALRRKTRRFGDARRAGKQNVSPAIAREASSTPSVTSWSKTPLPEHRRPLLEAQERSTIPGDAFSIRGACVRFETPLLGSKSDVSKSKRGFLIHRSTSSIRGARPANKKSVEDFERGFFLENDRGAIPGATLSRQTSSPREMRSALSPLDTDSRRVGRDSRRGSTGRWGNVDS